ncbi:MAG: RagB/SusD family nutrient uptake outer membrane protein [Prevotella sp.]|nr:RagB/SusD family nutrient uptake outer membrane protein [Prevotella sp.]
MKLKYILPAALFTGSFLFTSCVKDLEVDNINPQELSDFNQDYVFNKIYGNLVLTGQTGPNGDSDLDDIDEGTSNMTRLIWYLNVLTTDEAHCWWNDPGAPELNRNSWTNSNVLIKALYYRLMFGVTLCNFYLDSATGGDNETKTKRAEARFMRAFHYFYLMDFYANPPFLTKLSSENASQIQRPDLFTFLESELKDVIGEGSGDEILADARQTEYGRADKAAAYLLLARLYLNAEVYTGTARWADAKTYAEKAINTGYKLCETPKNGFSAYQLLFMGDNNENGAQEEIILPALHDGDKTQTWGGSLYVIASNMSSKMRDMDLYGATDANGDPIKGYGTTEAWDRGVRARKQFSQVFFGSTASSAAQGAPKDIVIKVADDRAIFYTTGQSLSIEDEKSTASGLIYMKYNNLHADGTAGHDPGGRFVDTDYPMLRLAEAYLISAEADARINGGNCSAEGVERIKALRKRANVKASNPYDGKSPESLTSVSLEDIFQEWSREFGYEGMRRMVLIRWNRFAGQSDYKWEWMGGTHAGTQFDKRFNIFPIPDSELNANPNIKPNYN